MVCVFGSWIIIMVLMMMMMMLLLVVCGMYYKKRNNKEKEERENEIPRGNSGWPFVGETLDFIACGYSSKPVTFMEKRSTLYGKVFRSHLLGRPVIVSTDPDVNKVILQNHGNVFVSHYPKSIKELMGGKNSLLYINGLLQKRAHALIGGFLRSPQFKTKITRYIELSIDRAFSIWEDHHNQPIYLQDESKKLSFEVMVKAIMSIGPSEELHLLRREFEEYTKGLISLPIKFPGTRLYKSLKAKERMLKVVREIIERKKNTMEDSNKHGKGSAPEDVLDLLIRDTLESEDLQPCLPLDSLGGNIVELMIPGEQTVPTTITLAIKYLGDNPTALARLIEENMELKRRKSINLDEYSWSDYISLPFTQHVISETLRMGNIINAVWREALKDVKIKGFLIPKGWCVLTSFTSNHMNEENYENPYEFNPWRWEKGGASVNSITFTPFGGGQRLCPGLELSRLEIAIFLHRFVTTYRWVAEDDEIVYFPVVRMKRRLPITITPLPPHPGWGGVGLELTSHQIIS